MVASMVLASVVDNVSPISFYLAVSVFVISYLVIISERYHRTIISLCGAMTLILLGVVHQADAIEGIDFNTLGLLIGMMVIVGIAKRSGMFQCVALAVAKVCRGRPIPLLALIGFVTALFSAVLDNVTTVLLMTPVAFIVANHLRVSPYPLLVSLILLSNFGGAATLIGDPPNILIGSAKGFSFNYFLVHIGPVAVLACLATIVLLVVAFRSELVADPERQKALAAFKPLEAITDWALLWKSLVVVSIVLIGFFTHAVTHFEAATIALSGAAILLLITVHDPESHLSEIEWTTIFFFVGLFILVAGLERVGAISMMARFLVEATGGDLLVTTMAVLWGSALLSAVVDNIPFVATMIPVMKEVEAASGGNMDVVWFALAIGADFGGAATLVGASANVTVAGMAAKEGHPISFMKYMKIASALTFVTLVISSLYLYLRYLA